MAPENHTFGQLIKKLRREQDLSLRQFCEVHSLDLGNQSKMERDLKPPPAATDKREELARQLGLSPEAPEWQTFFDLADLAAGRIPKEVLQDPELAPKLPLVFRSLRGEKLTEEQLKEVAELLRRS